MWETIDELTERLRVPSGWIVRSTMWRTLAGSVSITTHQVLVPDVGHKWTLPRRPKEKAKRGTPQ